MRPYPIMMNLVNKRVVVVGGGRVGLRKTFSLLESGARVALIARRIEPELMELETG